jgi:hypothetical protein
MTTLGVPQEVIKWTDHFLSNRKSGMSFDGQKEDMKPVVTEIPHGSPISPILFLHYLRPLFDEMESRMPEIWCPSYIDDVALEATGKDRETNGRTLERAADIVF